jgi:hypothetical protein
MILRREIKVRMKKPKVYLVLSTIPVIFFIIILNFYFFGSLDSLEFNSLFYGFLFSSLNFCLGVLSIHFGFEKSDNIFLIVILGGLSLRMVLMLILIVIALKFLFVSLYSFIFTTFILYFYYLIIEILILTEKKHFILKTKQ